MDLLIGFLYVALLTYLANIQHLTGRYAGVVRSLMVGLLVIMGSAGVSVLLTAQYVARDAPAGQAPISVAGAFAFFLAALILSGVGYALIQSETLRLRLKQTLFKHTRYDPQSPLHTLGILLAFVVVLMVVSTFLESGGQEGLAESVNQATNQFETVLLNGTIFLMLAFLAVGLYIRRDANATLQRLALPMPGQTEWSVGLVVGVGLFLLAQAGAILWFAVSAPDVFESQSSTSQAIFQQLNQSLIIGFLVALMTGVAEEILFRGVLQPVYGLIPTSIFFVAVHVQYTLTPASLILFLVTLGFGWLRLRFNTTTAVIAHIVYNAIPFLLIALLGG